ncbi:kinase-like domain-containing protein, partial [Blyttiomyces helicus]
HDHGIVHQDLKPENLSYRDKFENSDLVVEDFGVSNVSVRDDLLTTLCDSPMYTTPEIVRRTGHNKPADLWSIGVIAYCGFAHLCDVILRGRYWFDPPYWDNISPEAKELVRSLMEIRPEKRLTARKAMLDPWHLRFSP